MSEGDSDRIESRLSDAADGLIASFSDLDTDAELRAVRTSPNRAARSDAIRHRWLAAAAAVLVVGGTIALAATFAVRSDDANDSVSPIASTPDTTPTSVSAAPEPTVTTPRSTTPQPTQPAATVATTTAPSATSALGSVGPIVGVPDDLFVTVTDDSPSSIEVRDGDSIVASVDLGCPADMECVVQSARVMDNAIWVAITESRPATADNFERSRVVSIALATGEIVQHLSLDGTAAVRSAGRGADGIVYAHLTHRQPVDDDLVAIEQGNVRTLGTSVAGFRLSDNGRFLAVSYSNPPAGERARFEVTDLTDQTTASFQTQLTNAGPGAWSSDGQHLIINEQWEQGAAWIVDPWSGSPDPIPYTERILDGACFVNDQVVAHRTWNIGYGQGDAQPGVIRLTSVETGESVGEIGDDLFGEGFHCHPDGSITYVRRPVTEVELSPDFSQLEPDYDAPADLIHITPDGTASTLATGNIEIV